MKKRQLSPSRRLLIEVMQHLNFGRIIGISILDGKPDFSRPYRTIRTVKLAGGDNGVSPPSRKEINRDRTIHP